ncbi:MAG: DUF1629 domain-containing protein [Pseudomonadota bacterium]
MAWGLRTSDTQFNLWTECIDEEERWDYDTAMLASNGYDLDVADIPSKVRFQKLRKAADPDFFRGDSGLHLISSRLRAVLEDFDLGTSVLKDIEVVTNRGVPLETRYSALFVRDRKRCVVLEQTNYNLSAKADLPILKSLNFLGRDRFRWSPFVNDIYGLKGSDDGVDLWLDDLVIDSWFFSDRLAKAIKKARIKRFPIRKMTMIDGWPPPGD